MSNYQVYFLKLCQLLKDLNLVKNDAEFHEAFDIILENLFFNKIMDTYNDIGMDVNKLPLNEKKEILQVLTKETSLNNNLSKK